MNNLRSVDNRKSNFPFKVFIFLPVLLPWMDTPLLSPTSNTPVWHQTVFSSYNFVRCQNLQQLGLKMAWVTDIADNGVTKIPKQCMMFLVPGVQ
jgi:hypothetical protein